MLTDLCGCMLHVSSASAAANGNDGGCQADVAHHNARGSCMERIIGSHLGTLALKTESFSTKIGRFSKTRKWIY